MTANQRYSDPPELSYHLLRVSIHTFQKNLQMLNEGERLRVERKARKSFELEDLVLATPEAQHAHVPADQVDRAVQEVRSRYKNEKAFEEDLVRNGLNLDSLQNALRRELIFDAVLQTVGSRHESVNDIDVALFYEMNRDRFRKPERRQVRHILITVNEAFAENRRDVVLARMEQLTVRLDGKSNRFAILARQNSECPTAMEDGKLGLVGRGQLYPALDSVLFKLEEDEISGIVESELGFHILWCERIEKAKRIPLKQVRSRIRATLVGRSRRNCQKAWLADMKKRAAKTL